MKYLAVLSGVIFLLVAGQTTNAGEEIKKSLSDKEKVVALLTNIEA